MMCQINVKEEKHAKIQRLNCHFVPNRCTGKESIRRQHLICRADTDVQLCKNILDCDTHEDRGGGDERGGGSQLHADGE